MRCEEKYGLKKLLCERAEILKNRISKRVVRPERLTGDRINKKKGTQFKSGGNYQNLDGENW